MAVSWMYNGFPLKRADETTRGDDYQFVIQSLDAAIRHAFSFPAGVELTPPFSINASGDVEILQNLTIGSDVPIDEIVAEITEFAESDDDNRLANVTAIRDYTSQYIDDYLTTQNLFVLRAGDTMTGPLVADGGITASGSLEISSAVFVDSPALAAGMALQSNLGVDLIKFSSAVVVGDNTEGLQLTGASGRPIYNGENIAFVSDIAGTIPGMDYVPEAGGTFSGMVTFETNLLLDTGSAINMSYQGSKSFPFARVGDDAVGNVILEATGGFEFEGAVSVYELSIPLAAMQTVLWYSSGDFQVGHAGTNINLVGLGARPLYNDADLALYSDVGDTYTDGSGITFTGSGPIEMSITVNGINISHMPIGDNGQYSRISSGGLLEWSDLDIVGTTDQVVVATNPTTKQVTVSIDNEGIDTAQIKDGAVTTPKIAVDGVDYLNLDAVRTIPDAQPGIYQLIVESTGVDAGTLQWQKGGAAGVLGTLSREETAAAGVDNSDLVTDVVALAGTTGPYMIHEVRFTNLLSTREAVLTITIDGQTIPIFDEETIDYLEPDVIMNDADAQYDFPFFAKESFEIKFRRIGATTGDVTCHAKAVRMG